MLYARRGLIRALGVFSFETMKKVLLITLTICVLAGEVLAQSKTLPHFEDFPVKEKLIAKPATPKLLSSRARMFRTAIRLQTKGKPNFAGHYTIASWGCGTMSCTSFAIVDARTGDVYFPLGAMSIFVSTIDQAEDTIEFRPNSRLFILTGTIAFGDRDSIGKHYYVWRNNQLKLIRFIPDERFQGRGRN
jgi:hypothetical protein